MRELYLFDFDGTISSKDSMISYAKFINSNPVFYLKSILFGPIYLLLLLKIIDNQSAKNIFLKIFIGKYSKQELESTSEKFAIYFKKHIKPSALNYLNNLKVLDNMAYVIVSSSLDIWLLPIANDLGLPCICTKAIYKNGKYHGMETNCYGMQKVLRIKEKYTLEKFQNIVAFGDSKGDKEMLEIATQKHYMFFK